MQQSHHKPFIFINCRFKKPLSAQRRYSSSSHDSSLVTIQTERGKKPNWLPAEFTGCCDDRLLLFWCHRTNCDEGNGVKLTIIGLTRLIPVFEADLWWRFGVVAPTGAKLAHGEGRSFILAQRRFFVFFVFVAAARQLTSRGFWGNTRQAVGLRYWPFLLLSSLLSWGQRPGQLEDAFGRLRWWTANLFFRTDPPPTTPSPGLMSTARSSTAMGPSPRLPRRPTRTPTAKASRPVWVAHVHQKVSRRRGEVSLLPPLLFKHFFLGRFVSTLTASLLTSETLISKIQWKRD